MEKTTYTSFKEIELELRKLKLQRQIAIEEIKLLKPEFEEDLRPYQWVAVILEFIKRYGIYYFVRKLFK